MCRKPGNLKRANPGLFRKQGADISLPAFCIIRKKRRRSPVSLNPAQAAALAASAAVFDLVLHEGCLAASPLILPRRCVRGPATARAVIPANPWPVRGASWIGDN